MSLLPDQLERREEAARDELRSDDALKDLRAIGPDDDFDVASSRVSQELIRLKEELREVHIRRHHPSDDRTEPICVREVAEELDT